MLLVAFITVASISQARAQCTPDPNMKSAGISPTVLPDATVHKLYHETVTFMFPTDTAMSGIPVSIDSGRIDSVTNLPAGMTWQANKASRTYKPNEAGCILLSGTPTLAKKYEIRIYVTAYVVFAGTQAPYMLDNTVPLTVQKDTGVGVFRVNKLASTNISIYPNPAAHSATLAVSALHQERVSIAITNTAGSVIYTSEETMLAGDNNISLNFGTLAPGIYNVSVKGNTMNRNCKLVIR